MWVDVVCLIFVVAFLVLGLLSGFLSQVVRIAAFVGAFLLASFVSPYVRSLLMKWMDVENLFGDLLSLFLAWVVCFIVIVVIGTVLVKIIRGSSKSIKTLDRLMGGVLGGAKGFLIIYLVLCGLVLVRGPLSNLIPEKYLDLKGSRLASLVEQYNVFSAIGLPDVDKLGDLTLAFDDKQKRSELLNNPAIKDIQKNEAFNRLMGDKEFREAMAQNHLSAVLDNESFQGAINDPEIRRILRKLDWDSILKAVDKKANERER